MSHSENATKTCATCKLVKSTLAFARRARSGDGLQLSCRLCTRAYNAGYYNVHQEGIKEAVRGYRSEHLEETKARNLAWYHSDPPARRAHRKRTSARRAATQQAWKEANRERVLTYEVQRNRAKQLPRADRELTIAYRKAIRHDPCGYCGGQGEADDHIRPLSRGGTDHWWNLRRACGLCNSIKGTHCETWMRLRVNV